MMPQIEQIHQFLLEIQHESSSLFTSLQMRNILHSVQNLSDLTMDSLKVHIAQTNPNIANLNAGIEYFTILH